MNFPNAPKGDKRIKKWHYESSAKEMLAFINDGDVIYDVGANIGDHSIFFALEKKVNVFGFEPVPLYYRLALKNIAHYKAKNIKLFNFGISNDTGSLMIAKDNEGSSFLEVQKNDKMISVKVETIDNLVNGGLPKPDVIKLDVEGWAEQALIGAIETLREFKPTIILEPHPEFLSVAKLESKFDILESLGYSIIDIVGGDQYIFKVGNGKKFNDYRKYFKRQVYRKQILPIRNKYDSTLSQHEVKRLQKEYKDALSRVKVSLFQRLIWSKLYRLFTFKWLKTK